MNATIPIEDAAGVAGESLPLAPGRRLGDFLITRVVGQGGFGIVYEAEDLALQRRVAIKEYMPSQLAARVDDARVHPISGRYAKTFELGRRSFLAEARLLAQFRHPGLLEVLHFREQNGTAYMVMPFYEGRTLDRVLADEAVQVDEPWLKEMIRPLLDALEHMHAEDCYHRDVSADNILIREDGKALLLDLGAARRVIGDSERALTVMLKPGYAPIEQYADDPACRQGPWTDIYAVAAVLYFAITRRMPPASASRVMHDSLPPLATLRPEGYGARFLEAIDRALSIRPEQRPRTIAEFRSLLFAPAAGEEPGPGSAPCGEVPGDEAQAALGTASGATPVAASSATPVAGTRRHGVPIAIAVAVVSSALAFAWFAVAARNTDPAGARAAASQATSAAIGSAPAAATPRIGAADATPRIGAADTAPRIDAADAKGASAAAPSRGQAATAGSAQDAPAAAPVGKPVATGTLRLAVSPWGEVFVDGAPRGVTPPLKELSLGAGKHRIEIRNPAGPSWSREIVVDAGARTVVTHRFR